MASSIALESGKVAFQAFWNMPGKETAVYLGSHVISCISKTISSSFVSYKFKDNHLIEEFKTKAKRNLSNVFEGAYIITMNLTLSLSVSVITGALSANPAAATIAFISTMILSSIIPVSHYFLCNVFSTKNKSLSFPKTLQELVTITINSVGFILKSVQLGTMFGGVYGGVGLGIAAWSIQMCISTVRLAILGKEIIPHLGKVISSIFENPNGKLESALDGVVFRADFLNEDQLNPLQSESQ